MSVNFAGSGVTMTACPGFHPSPLASVAMSSVKVPEFGTTFPSEATVPYAVAPCRDLVRAADLERHHDGLTRDGCVVPGGNPDRCFSFAKDMDGNVEGEILTENNGPGSESTPSPALLIEAFSGRADEPADRDVSGRSRPTYAATVVADCHRGGHTERWGYSMRRTAESNRRRGDTPLGWLGLRGGMRRCKSDSSGSGGSESGSSGGGSSGVGSSGGLPRGSGGSS